MTPPDVADYAVVLSGEIMMGTTDGQRTAIKQGEVIVQLGAQHDWTNETGEWCRESGWAGIGGAWRAGVVVALGLPSAVLRRWS